MRDKLSWLYDDLGRASLQIPGLVSLIFYLDLSNWPHHGRVVNLRQADAQPIALTQRWVLIRQLDELLTNTDV